jgi:hypothetical protein
MGYQFDMKYVAELLPGIHHLDYSAACRYYAHLPRQMQIEAHRQHTAVMRTRWHERRDGKQAEFIFATFVQTVAQMRRLERAPDSRNVLSDRDAQRVSDLREARIEGRKSGKSAPTRKIIEKKYMLLIDQMRTAGKSWRYISHYIAKYHRQKFSYSYLRQIYHEIRNTNS